ncbi:MAG TPA: hypothetical protein VMU43_02970 [Candidatus Acidoferrum sp.]|nr:hypothetical protein [Candidatus Acidoferrum sp.]
MADDGRNSQLRKTAVVLAGLVLAAASTQAQSKSRRERTDTDRLGMTCTQILKLSSTDWVAKFAVARSGDAPPNPQENAGTQPAAARTAVPPEITIRAIDAYGKCYDARTERLAGALGRSGKGPLMGARGDFGDFENALKEFEATVLQDSQPPADDVKKAYAGLYEKQFRYAFYYGYTEAGRKAAAAEAAAAAAENAPKPKTRPQATSGTGAEGAAVPAARPGESTEAKTTVGNAAGSNGNVEASKKTSADTVAAFTKTKNRFGQLLEALPPDHAREVHAAFGKVLGSYEVSQDTRRDLYLYAIFLLEPPDAKPFGPPPF